MDIRDLAPIAIVFVAAGITLSVAANISQNIATTFSCTRNTSFGDCARPATQLGCCKEWPNLEYDEGIGANKAALNTTTGLGELAKWLPTIGLVLAAAVIIGTIFTSMYLQQSPVA